jgi:hypothetical protein
MKRIPLLIFPLAVALFGCGKDQSDRRFLEIAVNQKNNTAAIRELSRTVEGINKRLAGVERTLQNLAKGSPTAEKAAPASPAAPPPAGPGGPAVSRQVAALTEELTAMRDELASTKNQLEKSQGPSAEPKDPIKRILSGLLESPAEFVAGLDKLLETVSPGMEDPTARQNFEAELLQLREHLLSGYPTDDLYRDLHSRYVEKFNSVTDPNNKEAIQREITYLENCSDEELQKRLADHARDRAAEDFSHLVKSYNLRMDDIIPSFSGLPRKE